ncbi:MAG: hypothetical protein M1491_07230 [Deltaproteobacteria bacterium]|nr:hypothetical protein [Deltaproteobacteria bacterium]MCL5276530.1 hypothetical protein [Deltaproteobacteria bacterium]
MRTGKLFIFILALTLAGLVHGCSSTPSNATQQHIDYLLAQGKTELSNQQYLDAETNFETILNTYDPNNNQARFGAAIAILLNQIDSLVGQLTSLLQQFGFKLFDQGTPVLRPQFVDTGMSAINLLIAGFLNNAIMNSVYQAKGYFDAIIKSGDKNFTFQIDSLPLSIGSGTLSYALGDYGGVYDMEEVYYFDALMNGIDGALDLAMAINLDMSLSSIVSYVMAPGRLSNLDIDTVLEALGFIMVSSPNVLTIEPADGTQNIAGAQLALSTALQDIIDGVNFIKSPPHGESTNVITYGTDSKGNPTLVLHMKSLGASGYTTSTVNIPITSSSGGFITDIAARVMNNINGGQPYTTFNDDIAPVLSMAVVALFQSNLVQSILNAALAGLGTTSQSTLKQLMGFINVDTLTGLLTSVVPGNIELDLGQYFKSPASLRSIMPAWVAPGLSGTTVTGYTFTAPNPVNPLANIVSTIILEYECPPSDLAKTLFYCGGTTFSATAHFLGPNGNGIPDPDNQSILIGPIPNPGIPKAYLPYIPFMDPTLGKVLYTTATCSGGSISPSTAATCNVSGQEHNPSLLELNYLVQELGQTIFSLIGSGTL